MFSPSAQCTEAANKARQLIFMIKRSFQDLSKSAFIPLCGALVRPHLEYGMPACSPNLVADINRLELLQRLTTRLVTVMRLLPYEGRLQCRCSSFRQCFQKNVGESLDRSLSPSPPLTEHSPHLTSLPPFPPAHHPLTVIISICNPTPCSIHVISSGSLWPTFCHYKT